MDKTTTDGANLSQVLTMFRRRWGTLVLVWALAAGLAALYSISRPKLYRPQATLEIRPERSVVPATTDNFADTNLWENYFRTQQNILTSEGLVAATIAALPPALRAPYEGPGGVQAFQKQIDLEQVRQSFILKVGFVDPEPEKATQITNILVATYLEDASRRMRALKSTAASTLENETLPDIRKSVAASEKSLQEFQAKTGFIDFEERYKVFVDAWRRASSRLTDLRLERARLTAEIDSLKGYESGDVTAMFHPSFNRTKALESLGAERARLSELIATESLKLKEDHPRMKQMKAELASVEGEIKEAVSGTLSALKTDQVAVVEEEKALTAELKNLEKEMADAGAGLNEYRRLDSELTASKELYQSYLMRRDETSATAGTGLSSVRVVDFAKIPDTPWKPNTKLNLLLGLAAGLALGLMAMFCAEQLDKRILAPDDVRTFVGTDTLAAIPKLKGRGHPVVVSAKSRLSEFEAFRSLRAQVVTRMEKILDGRVLAVLSPLPGDGKSTVSSNLAKVLAMEGKRVLLFDADMRKPGLTSLHGASEGPDLEEVLNGTAELADAIRPSTIEGVDIVGARRGTAAAAELADSARYTEALKEAKRRYDMVIVDCAPVLQASEAALIARRSDAAILVVREGQTGRGAARAAAERLQGMDVLILGAVLNCAAHQRGGFTYGARYGLVTSGYWEDWGGRRGNLNSADPAAGGSGNGNGSHHG